MFTGLIQALGRLQPLGADQLQITYGDGTDGRIFQDLALGDSVAVDGVCLTVIAIQSQGFVAVASPETLRRSTLGQQSADRWVNLEISLRVGSKLGGHFVTGHVDGMGYLQTVTVAAQAWEMGFHLPDGAIARYIVSKGSIAINGVSLTVADCNPEGTWFTVAVIPHTYTHTNLQQLQPGSAVNLEADILGKYVEKFLYAGAPLLKHSPAATTEISAEFLAEHGYL
ncbi:riboflavin synthase subunit alpha [Neosynechococcus sphagnicola sy1]|uniref:Riboflavin synthase n=1 Tax=Neosynechococcus sphagnicola sy1 TaxID=1497020 RepID=A0A098TIQ6_9CYAN|nr:riboflavin synthase [Neosynechococcus sphagnicola]KGF71979.1 riboflavin synthase subunit alpha [Neosynechococcus sphagnicola sy1]